MSTYLNKSLEILNAYVPVLHEFSNKKLIWDLFQAFIISYWLFLSFISIIFEFWILDSTFSIFNFTMMQTNILVEINTSFFNKGVLEINREVIFFNYIKKKFIDDIIFLIPFVIA